MPRYCLVFVSALILSAQTPAFEVASIRQAVIRESEGSGRSRIEYSGDSLTMRNVDLKRCVQWAYGVDFFQIPDKNALDGLGYDIRANAGEHVSPNQLRKMLQQLLADRFKLTLHRETRTLPVYALTVAKGGPKLPSPNDNAGHHATESLPRVQDGSFFFADASMAEFAAKLSQLRGIDRPVVDQTGIDGYFDIIFKGAAAAQLQPDGPSLYTLIQEQLGLKLVATKAPLEIIVIDRAERPSEN